MLSPEDQERLAAIERALSDNDPDLARRLRRDTRNNWLWDRAASNALLLLDATGLLFGISTLDVLAVLVAGVAPLWAGVHLRRTRVQRTPQRRTGRL